MERSLPSLNAARAFEAFARHGSMTAAASALGVTHGAVSRQVKALEDWLGVALVRRARRGLELTDEGRSYLGVLTNALDAIAAGTEALRIGQDAATLRVSTTYSIANALLVPNLAPFAERHPQIELSLVIEPGLSDPRGGTVDVALRMGRGPWPGLQCVAWLRDRLVPVAATGYLAKAPEISEPGDLLGHRLLHDREPGAQWSEWLAQAGLRRHRLPGPRFSGSSLVLDAATGGQGIALARERLARERIRAGQLVRLPLPAVDLGWAYWIVTDASAMRRAKVAVFVSWLLELARDPTFNDDAPDSDDADVRPRERAPRRSD